MVDRVWLVEEKVIRILSGCVSSLFFPEFFQCLRRLTPVKGVMQRQTWAVPKHPRTRIPHDFLRFLPHLRLITVRQTFATGGFLFLKRALVQSHESIRQKLGAFRTQVAVNVMVTFAVYVKHDVDGSFLSYYSRMLLAHVSPFPKEYVEQ
jgi:hypothetical protein